MSKFEMIEIVCVGREFEWQIFRPKDQLNLSDAYRIQAIYKDEILKPLRILGKVLSAEEQ